MKRIPSTILIKIPRPVTRNLFRIIIIVIFLMVILVLVGNQPEITMDQDAARMTMVNRLPGQEQKNATMTNKTEESYFQQCLHVSWKEESTSTDPEGELYSNEGFKSVPHTDVYVYSVYYDKRLQEPNITILGLATMKTTNLHCLIRYPYDNITISMPADVEVIREAMPPYCHWKAARITCNNPYMDKDPDQVSLVISTCAQPEVQLPLTIISPYETPSHKFGVCMQALFGYKTRDIGYIIEHIEMNKLLGAEQIFIYGLYNVSRFIKSVVNYYVKEGSVTLVPWKLPVSSLNKWQLQEPNQNWSPENDPKDKTFTHNPSCVRQNAHYLANLHCMYANMNDYKYLFYMDMDEFLVPQKHPNWKELFIHLEKQPGYEGYASLLFREAQFCADREQEESSALYINSHCYTRISEVRGAYKSPKPVIRSKRVTRIQVNTAQTVLPGYHRELVLEPSLAKKHVYKKASFCRSEKKTTDKTMENFKNYILPRLSRVANEAGVP